MAKAPENDINVPEFHANTNGKSILILTADNTHDLEFFVPYYRFIEEGYEVDVATPKGGKLTCKFGLGLKSTKAITEVDAHDYCLLYIPGGKAPSELKANKDAIALAKSFAENQTSIAAICHGPQLLAAANLIKGKKIAAWPEVQKEIEDAGGTYEDKATTIDGLFITARWPGDLPSHMSHTLQALRDRELTTGSPVSVLRAAK